MAFYCGTDIVEVYRIKDAITSTPGFIKKVFSENEISQIEKINSKIQDAMSKEETIKQKIYPVDIFDSKKYIR